MAGLMEHVIIVIVAICMMSHLSFGYIEELPNYSNEFFQAISNPAAGCHGCVQEYSSESGAILTPPNLGDAHTNCEWKITVPIGKTIRLEVRSSMTSGDVTTCGDGGITLYNGDTVGQGTIATLCGGGATTIFSSGNVATVRFYSLTRGNSFNLLWSTDPCPGEVFAENGHCYEAATTAETFDDAVAYCMGLGCGAHIVDVSSAAEESFARQVLQDAVPNANTMWFGGRRPEGGKRFNLYWVSDNSLINVYTNWVPGQPYKGSPDADCISASEASGWKWGDNECYGFKMTVCEY